MISVFETYISVKGNPVRDRFPAKIVFGQADDVLMCAGPETGPRDVYMGVKALRTLGDLDSVIVKLFAQVPEE